MNLLIRIFWFFIIFLAISIGIFPFSYLFIDMSQGFLGQKDQMLVQSSIWNLAFYGHITFGALALLLGWLQFVKKIRLKRTKLHRFIGYVYAFSVVISGVSGFYLAIFANGGISAKLGFGGLAFAWLMTTSSAYLAIRYQDFSSHGKWMIRSYALTFAAVTLRLYMPLLEGGLGMDGATAYQLVSWLCWLPNLLIAQWVIQQQYKQHDS